jgi:formylglycine-generating enzyme required for sulfatase activity
VWSYLEGAMLAISAKLVTVEQYRKFEKDYLQESSANEPAMGRPWHHFAAYCNWLSNEERIPKNQWCYEVTVTEGVTNAKAKEKYLSLNGYRLSTLAEIEYATRAGSTTSRYYGESEDLLSKYARYSRNSQDHSWPVGGLKPNDFGVFDAYGNAQTWCQDTWNQYTTADDVNACIQDTEEIIDAHTAENLRVHFGGAFNDPARTLRSQFNGGFEPSGRAVELSFRVARTLAP